MSVRKTSSGENNALRSHSWSQLPKLTVWSTSWASFASKIIMKSRQTTMLWVSGRGLGFQASESTLTQLTLQSTDPRNKKQLLGLPRSTWSEQKKYSILYVLYMFWRGHSSLVCKYSLIIMTYITSSRSSRYVHSWAWKFVLPCLLLTILKRREPFPGPKQMETPCHWAPGAAGVEGPRVRWSSRKAHWWGVFKPQCVSEQLLAHPRGAGFPRMCWSRDEQVPLWCS